jgi:hypothetical protein
MDTHAPEQIVKSAKAGWLPAVRKHIKCAVLYGSRSVADAEVRLDSDLDIFLVTKQEVNPVIVVDSAVKFFNAQGYRCDPFWYVEDYFYDALDAGIDCTLWHHVFQFGRIVYAESELLDRVCAALRVTSLSDSFQRSIAVRRDRDAEHLQALIRNTDRILTEAILLAYSRAMGLSTWDALPDRRSLTSVAVKAGVIDENMKLIADRLSALIRRRDLGLDEAAFEELAGLRVSVARFVNNQLK